MSSPTICFRFDPAFDLHVKGYAACRGCTSVPLPCPQPTCNGLIHSEDWREGDEYGPYNCGASVCDGCGLVEMIPNSSLEEAEAVWHRRDVSRQERDEEIRKETAPLPSEIVKAWIAAVPSQEVVEVDGPMELIFDENTGEGWEKQTFRPTAFPNFKKFRAAAAAGDLTKLFRSSERAKIFAEFIDRIRDGSSPNARAAAIAFSILN